MQTLRLVPHQHALVLFVTSPDGYICRAYQILYRALSMCDVQTTSNSNKALNHRLSVNAPTVGVPTRAVAEP